ncbi:Hypothetical predicted protein [Paramuricea clavata]|uniref:Uncharacterized protein n=1 Tax=Paramuricea clavata TaxID=317549 RepID=A0A6S7G2G9_PARCT|nr:Hypothetical predicted protein [Paramuricea clavata]
MNLLLGGLTHFNLHLLPAKKCTVYDIVFHTETYRMGQKDPRFKQLILDTTFDAIERNWKIKLDRKNLKYPKVKFKGTKTSTIIRTSNDEGVKNAGADIEIGNEKLPYPYKNETPDVNDKTNESSSRLENGPSSDNHSRTPKYSIVHRGHLDLQNFTNARDSRASTRPQELVVNIELPLCASSAGVDLDIFEKQLVLDSSDPNYHLDITLPYPVNEDDGRAQFDKSKRALIVTLPVVPAPPIALNGYADNEAAESKVNGLVTEIVNDKVECGLEHVVNDDDDDDGATDSNDNDGGDSNNGGNENYRGHGNKNYGDHGIESTGDGNNVDHNCDGSVKDIEKGLNNLDVSDADVSTDGCKDVVQEQRSGVTCPVFKTPPYSFHQNNESVTFVLHVAHVSLDTMSLGFNGNKCCISFPSTSITSTNFLSPGYALHIEFPDECLIDSEKSSVDLNETNLVLILYKQVNCVGTWRWFMIGSDEHTLEKKVFLTGETLQESLNEVEDNWAQQPLTVNPKVESASEEETVIQVDIKSENLRAADSSNMGNILAGADELLFSEVKNGSSDTVVDNVVQGEDEIKNDTLKDCNKLNAPDDTVVMINYADLDEVEFIEENYDENEADGLNEPERLSTVQEIEPTNEVSNN